MSSILVINAGSSSVKYQLVDAETGECAASGLVERIGEATGLIEHRADETTVERETAIPDHAAAFDLMRGAFEAAGTPLDSLGIAAVGHRVVMGGSEFTEPTLIDAHVIERVDELSALAPLHNPGNLQAIVAAREAIPNAPHVAVFDTAFHQSMPEHAYTYAIDREIAERYGVRRFGFHGISHQVVSRRAAELLGRPVHELKQVVLHLGNGASACAVDRGASVATSMGLTPLEGLVMGTRGGDLDPGVMLHLLRAGVTPDELDEMLNKGSGLRGLTGSNDMRDVRAAADAGDTDARLALDVVVHRIRHYIGAYLAALGGADAIVFTAGVGENNPALRSEACAGLEWLGVEIDPELNEARDRAARRISTDASRIAVLVVPTDEEAEIARQTWALVGAVVGGGG